ncbi:MAG: hypothetical protein ACJ74J_10045 [Blastocatellia bacterium]
MADIVAIVALIISIFAVVFTYKQTSLLRRTIEAQTYTTLLERAREIDISSTIDFINSLTCRDFATYQKSVPQEWQSRIRMTVDFFNDISHMIRNEYLDDYYPIRLYRPTLLTCSQKLLPWWLEGIRTSRGITGIYNNFQLICEYASYLESEKEARQLPYIPKLGYRAFLGQRGITPGTLLSVPLEAKQEEGAKNVRNA